MITVVYHLLCQITIPLAHHFLSYGTSKPISQFLSHPHCSHLLKALTQTHLLLIHTNLLLMRTHLLLMPYPPTPYAIPTYSLFISICSLLIPTPPSAYPPAPYLYSPAPSPYPSYLHAVSPLYIIPITSPFSSPVYPMYMLFSTPSPIYH